MLTVSWVLFVLLVAPLCWAEKLLDAQIPDLAQSNTAFVNEGKDYCAPVAVSNSLMYLGQVGYPAFLTRSDGAISTQVQLVNTLASETYMGTVAKGGTGYQSIVRGVKKFVSDHGSSIRKLAYAGLELYYKPDEPSPSIRVDLKKSAAVSLSEGAVWIGVGWYRHDSETDEYQKVGGHWATMVGLTSPATLLVHDPSTDAGDQPMRENWELETLDSGTIHGYGLPQSAVGVQRIVSGVHPPEKADVALLEGVIVFELDPPKTESR